MATLNTCPFSSSMIICFFNLFKAARTQALASVTSISILPTGFHSPTDAHLLCIDSPAPWFFSREVSEVSCLPIRLPYGIPLLMWGECGRVTAPARRDFCHSSSLQLTSACPGRQWGHKSLATFHSQDGQGYFHNSPVGGGKGLDRLGL